MVGAGSSWAIDDTTGRTAARTAYRARIESLLDESGDEPLADVWQRVCPFPVDAACELPDRRGIIEDLADFAEVLRPSLDGMQAHRLCRLIEKYAARGSRQLDQAVSRLARRTETWNYRIQRVSGSELVGTLHR
jgi:hypothetical protein